MASNKDLADVSEESDMETESEKERKRKRDQLSSVSENDTSIDEKSKAAKKKKKKEELKKNEKDDKKTEKEELFDMKELCKEIKSINKKMTNMLTKNDKGLKDLIVDVFNQMKTELLKSVFHRIEILENNLFEKSQENDQLKIDVQALKTDLEAEKEERSKMQKRIDTQAEKTLESFNKLEQYGRRNNLRINGLDEKGNETPEATTGRIVTTLNDLLPGVNLQREDVDIAHRLGKHKGDRKRQVIVKFVSRMTKEFVLKQRRHLKGTGIFLNEDLTHVNQHVLACLRKKMPDEVSDAWSINGTLFVKDKLDSVREVPYHEFNYWIDLHWPDDEVKKSNKDKNY